MRSKPVQATRGQTVMESETRAFNSAYAQIHMAMNVVNNSAYDELNHNLVLQDAVAGVNGGTIKTTTSVTNETTTVTAKMGGETSGYVSTSTTTTSYSNNEVGGWLDDGLAVPNDSHPRIADLSAALDRQTDRGRSGRVVVHVADGWPA